MKILFLDIDGVLNSEQSSLMYWRQNGKECLFVNENHFCLVSCSNLLSIIEECPDVRIVISSSWRVYHTLDEIRGFFEKFGLDPKLVIGETPDSSQARGLEIQQWLDENAPIEDFIIVDDEADMVHLADKFVQTDGRLGLTILDARRIVEKFKGETNG